MKYALGENQFKSNFMINHPRKVTLELTRDCPLNCLICSSNGGSPHPKELSLQKWIDVVDESLNLGTKSFMISGGEPFAFSYFKELCQYISNKNISLSIYTSGNIRRGDEILPLNNDELDLLSNLGSVKLVFNLQGSNSKIHDLMTCVKGSFVNILSSIKLAVDYDLKIEVHFVPTSINYKKLPEIVSLCKDIGVKKVSVLRFVPQGRGKINEKILKLGSSEIMHLRNILVNLTESDNYVRVGSPFNPFLLSKQHKCTAGCTRMTIRYDGFVFPCEALKFVSENFNDNNVRRYSMKEIWENSQIFQLARNFQNLINKSECLSCTFFNKCRGGCPVQRLLTGTLEHVDPYCLAIIQTALTQII